MMAPSITVKEHERKKLVEDQDNITLNGEPARIGGWRCDYATVTILPDGMSVEFSWHAVKFVVENRNGAFRA